MRGFGQHFLKDRSVLEKIAETIDVKSTDVILEIGPGHGELTEELLGAKKIIAIEKSYVLAKELRERLADYKNLEIIEGDILKKLKTITSELSSHKLVGNIPYYITGFLLRLIGELKNKPDAIVFMLQKEVAERITARPPKMNLLAASVQFWADPEVVTVVSKSAFSPEPQVDSSIVRLVPKRKSIPPEEEEDYYRLIKALFKQPRKTIMNNLASGFKLERSETNDLLKKAKLREDLRPQNLKIEEIEALSALFGKRK